jgi:hypothetical protein
MESRVFKNLTRGAWSVQIRVDGKFRTVAHAQGAAVSAAVFYASEASRLRCLAANKKEVHAWTTGNLTAVVGFKLVDKYATPELVDAFAAVSADSISDLPVSVSYRPRERSHFRIRSTLEIVATAARAHFTADGGCTVE